MLGFFDQVYFSILMFVVPEELKEKWKNSVSLKYFQVNKSQRTKGSLFSLPSMQARDAAGIPAQRPQEIRGILCLQ